MDVRVHTNPSGFGQLARSWNELLERSETTSVFSRHEYLSTWLDYFGGDHAPFVVEVRADGRAVGFAPLLRYRGADEARIEFCAMARFADYCGLVVEPGFEKPVVSALFDQMDEQRASSLTLDHLCEGTKVFEALEDTIRQRGLLVQPMAVTRAPFVRIEGSWDQFIRQRSRNTYRDLRKKINRLDGTAGLEVEVISGLDEYSFHVTNMLNMHLKLWISRGVGTPYRVRARRLFLEELGRTMLEKGLLRFTCLNLEGRAAAYLWCYDHKGVRHYLNAAWDTDHAALSPGSLLLINDLRDAFDTGLAEYDMLGGEEPYKYRYATGRRHVTTLVLDHLDRPRKRITPLRNTAAPAADASPGVTGDTRRHNLLITAHPDDEAIFFGALLRSEPQTRWTHCLTTIPPVSPMIRRQRLAEFHRSCDLLGLEPVFLDLEEQPPQQSLDPEAIARALEDRFSGCHFDEVYSHGAFGEYGHQHHAAVSLATHEVFGDVRSLAGPLTPEVTLREAQTGTFPDKLAYFQDVHQSQLYLAELVAPEERYVRLTLNQTRLIHRIFFKGGEGWLSPLSAAEVDQAQDLFAPLFDAYFSGSHRPAELAGAAGSRHIDVITPIQVRILEAAVGLMSTGGGEALEGFIRQLARNPGTVSPGAAGVYTKLMSLHQKSVN